ncbi:MAG: hypothetical protein LIP28_00575, partial [Deltaproteobacteria bacterium]|nr:hypothetical protein [Deltaproteobacteria bacterium]
MTVSAVAGAAGATKGTAVAVDAADGGDNTLSGKDVALNAGRKADDPLGTGAISYGDATGVRANNAANTVTADTLEISALAKAVSGNNSSATGVLAESDGSNTLTADTLDVAAQSLGGTATG